MHCVIRIEVLMRANQARPLVDLGKCRRAASGARSCIDSCDVEDGRKRDLT